MIGYINFTAPSRAISINEANKMHWANRRLHNIPWRETFRAAYRAANLQPVNVPIIVAVSIPFERNSRRDPHNYVGTVVKTLVDVLVNEGYIKDDTHEYVTILEPELRVDKSGAVHVMIYERTPENYPWGFFDHE
jgi:hypothetical protein